MRHLTLQSIASARSLTLAACGGNVGGVASAPGPLKAEPPTFSLAALAALKSEQPFSPKLEGLRLLAIYKFGNQAPFRQTGQSDEVAIGRGLVAKAQRLRGIGLLPGADRLGRIAVHEVCGGDASRSARG